MGEFFMAINEIKICKECGAEYRDDLPICPLCTDHYNEVYNHTKLNKINNQHKINYQSSYPSFSIFLISTFTLLFIIFIIPTFIRYLDQNDGLENNVNQPESIVYQSLKLNDDIQIENVDNKITFIGTISNLNASQMNGAMITIALLNDEETVLDTASDYVDYIPANGLWEYKVSFYSVTINATKYRVVKVVGNN